MYDSYYIEENGTRHGPHDVITLMRRIRTQKITRDTVVYNADTDETLRAGDVDELAPFFERLQDSAEVEARPRHVNLYQLISNGWNYTSEHSIMTVYAGVMMLCSLLVGFGLYFTLGTMAAAMLSWVLFFVLHTLYLVFTLRRYRGQVISHDFIAKQLSPKISDLVTAGIVCGTCIALGCMLFFVPGLIVFILTFYIPFLLVDYKFSPPAALRQNILHTKKMGLRYMATMSVLCLAHFLGILLILPAPLTIPIFSAALAELYEFDA